MRRSILLRDLLELVSGDTVRTVMSEKLAIQRQANLMRVSARMKHEREEALARQEERRRHGEIVGTGASPKLFEDEGSSDTLYENKNNSKVMTAEEIAERAAQHEADHLAAAKRSKMQIFKSLNPSSENASMFMPAPIDLEGFESTRRCAAPPNWPKMAPGWVTLPDSSTVGYSNNSNEATSGIAMGSIAVGSSSSAIIDRPMVVQKTYCFLDQPMTYKFLGMVAAAVNELGFPSTVTRRDEEAAVRELAQPTSTTNAVSAEEGKVKEEGNGESHLFATPRIEWMWSEITVTMLSTPQTYTLALYLNDLEGRLGTMRNVAMINGEQQSEMMWSRELEQKIEAKASTGFLWMFGGERSSMANYIQSLYIQWSNRAEYLINRKSRERKEFRPNLTLSDAIKEGAERKRRAERRKFKDKLQTAAPNLVGMERDEFERYSFDTLPRETRERMDEDRSKVGGMEESRKRIGSHNAFARASSWGA